MKSQQQSGGQSNSMLVMRTKVDWHCPLSCLGIMDLVCDAAKVHCLSHVQPLSKLKFGLSKVMTRLQQDRGRIPM